MSNETKTYLGDAVYCDTDGMGQLVLTVENGISVTDTIYLDAHVWRALVEYVERARAEGRVP